MADEPNVDGLRAQAEKILRGNDVGEFTKPSPRQYPHQWNWDAALIALGLSHFDLPRALTEIRALLRGQWRDGMMPHILYHTGPSDYFPDPDFWQITNSPNAPADGNLRLDTTAGFGDGRPHDSRTHADS